MYDTLPIEIAASGMNAQRIRMGIVSSNLANALTTRNAEGTGPYQRRLVEFQATAPFSFQRMLADAVGNNEEGLVRSEPEKSQWLLELHMRGVQVSNVVKAPNFREVEDPSHPDADPVTGVVKYPDINVIEEMTDMIMASRQYEGNLAVIKNTKDMIMQLLDLLRT